VAFLYSYLSVSLVMLLKQIGFFIKFFFTFIFFVLSKFLIEKIIGTAFNIEEFVEQFNLQKSYIEPHQFVYTLPVMLYSSYDSISKKYSYCIYIYYSVY
jgi:hypothetical protein